MLLPLLVVLSAAEVRTERLSWSLAADGEAPVRRLVVRNDYGDIRARFAEDRTLEAWAVVQRLDPAPPGVGFTLERRGSTVALTVAYPPGRVRDADPNPPKHSYDRLDVTVFVPEGVALEAQTLRGMVEARGLKSDLRAATLDGEVLVATTGTLHARTESGSITATRPAATDGRLDVVESASGAITVRLPESPAVELRVETGGEIVSNLELRPRRQGAGTVLAGSVGRPGRLIVVRSESGRVEIRRDLP
jgi:hypothetical protein